MVAKKTNKLIMASPPTFCTECHTAYVIVSADGTRIVVRHGDNKIRAESPDCSQRARLWSYPQPTVTVTEV
jgi:hypothetical protein